MSQPGYVAGVPGIRANKTSSYRLVGLHGDLGYLTGLKIIDGSESRDPGNTSTTDRLRPGLLMGEITSSGLYAPSIVGVLTAAYTSGGTELTVSAAVATEMDRIAGQSGTAEFVAIGPPSAAGTVAVTDIDHSAINTSTGAITVTDLAASKVVGTFIARKDGRQIPKTFIPDVPGFPMKVTDTDGASVDIEFSKFPVSGAVDASQLIPWPSDTSLQAWLIAQLNTTASGQFIFDSDY